MVSMPVAGAIVRIATSPPCASTSCSAASSPYSSLPLTTVGEAERSSLRSGPSRSAFAAGSGTGLLMTRIRTRLALLAL